MQPQEPCGRPPPWPPAQMSHPLKTITATHCCSRACCRDPSWNHFPLKQYRRIRHESDTADPRPSGTCLQRRFIKPLCPKHLQIASARAANGEDQRWTPGHLGKQSVLGRGTKLPEHSRRTNPSRPKRFLSPDALVTSDRDQHARSNYIRPVAVSRNCCKLPAGVASKRMLP